MSAPAQKPSPSAAPSQPVARPAAQPATQASAQGPQVIRLKRGELLFDEGDNSRVMYLIRTGMIRLYKKKGDSFIELDTVHSGQVLGELAFLDGNPRSASGEALTDCELIEISGPTFQQVLGKLPDWLKILMKTIVGRLRAASTRIRQLESASSAYDYSDDGKRTSHYVYLSAVDCLRICTALLLVASRNAESSDKGIEIRVGLLQRYANQIMGIPVAKITSMLDILAQSGVTSFGDEKEPGTVYLQNPDFLEQLIAYMNEENLLEPSKRHDLSPRGFLILSLMVKHLSRYTKDAKTGLTTVNLAEVKSLETPVDGPMAGKEPFRCEEFGELAKLGYGTTINVKSSTEIFTTVDADTVKERCRLQKVVMGISAANELRRSNHNKA